MATVLNKEGFTAGLDGQECNPPAGAEADWTQGWTAGRARRRDYRIEGLPNFAVRIHAPGIGYADIYAPSYTRGIGWKVEVFQTNVRDEAELQAMLDFYKRQEEIN